MTDIAAENSNKSVAGEAGPVAVPPQTKVSIQERCQQKDCDAAVDGVCQMGLPDLRECQHWSGAKIPAPDESEDQGGTDESLRPPWTGRALGAADLAAVVGRVRPALIGLLGSSNAGKTTFLMGMYLGLHHGRPLGPYDFAGSLTLGGWENLAEFGRFHAGQPARFPPHTSMAAGRQPSLLHLALRRGAISSDVHAERAGPFPVTEALFADAPGEWFDRWTIAPAAPEAAGARWIMEHADGLALFMDCEALTGDQRGPATAKLVHLIERMGGEVAHLPLAVVWSKADLRENLRETIRVRLHNALERYLPAGREFAVRAGQPDPTSPLPEGELAPAVAWLLDRIAAQAFVPAPAPDIAAISCGVTEPFMLYRGHPIPEEQSPK